MPNTVSRLPDHWRALADAARHQPFARQAAEPSDGRACAATLRACADELQSALARADPEHAGLEHAHPEHADSEHADPGHARPELVARAERDVDAGLAGTTAATRAAIRAEGIALLADLYVRFAAYGFTPDNIPVGTVTPYALVDIALDALGTAHYRSTRRTGADAGPAKPARRSSRATPASPATPASTENRRASDGRARLACPPVNAAAGDARPSDRLA